MVKQKRHFIVINRTDGSIEKHPLKQWLRLHTGFMPKGYSGDNTTHQLRSALHKDGWEIQENDGEVLLIKPFDENEDDETITSEENVEEITFGLERDMQQALRVNIGQLDPGLQIIDKGIERISEAGRIDITAEDKDKNIVIIELKAGTANPDVIAQVLAYMGSVYEEEKKPVRGILVAGDFNKKVSLAAKAISNLKLFKYTYKFTFEEMT